MLVYSAWQARSWLLNLADHTQGQALRGVTIAAGATYSSTRCWRGHTADCQLLEFHEQTGRRNDVCSRVPHTNSHAREQALCKLPVSRELMLSQ